MTTSIIDIKFLEHVTRELSKKKICLNIHPSRRTPEGNYGYFDDEEKVMAVALYNELGFNAVLAHEFRHYQQYLDDPNLYQGYNILSDWVSVGKERIKNYTHMLSNETIEESCLVVLACEKDAEEYVLRAAEEWKFENFDKEKYTQYINLYLWSIRHSFEFRQYPKMNKKDKQVLFRVIPKDRIISIFEACNLPREWVEWWNEKQENIRTKNSSTKDKIREVGRFPDFTNQS